MSGYVDWEELLESWINGNKTHVIDVLAKLKPLQAALTAAYMYSAMENYDRGVFGRMLQERRDSPRRHR